MIPISVIGNKGFIFNLSDAEVARGHGILGTLSGTLSLAPQQNVLLGLPLQLMAEEVVWLVKSKLGFIIPSHELFQTGFSDEEPSQVEGLSSESESKTPVFFNVENTCNDPAEIKRLSNAYEEEDIQHELLAPFSSDSQLLFNHLKDQGFMLCPGMRFGGTFVAYPGDPLRYHSHLIVNSREYYDEDIGLNNIVNGGRLSTGVKKLWLVGGQLKDEMRAAEEVGAKDEENISCFSIEWAGFG